MLWADCDDPESIRALARFRPEPAIVIRTSERGRHAYWPLQQPLPPGKLEQANRRLAHALGACQSAVTNAAAVLRPSGTLNWKYDPPPPVSLERFTREHCAADQVAGHLEDPPLPQHERRQPSAPSPAWAADPLLAIETAVYVEALTGLQVGRDGKVACPFHPDTRPSLHAYPDHWTCYSAKCWRGDRPNGGDIYSLAGQLWLTGQSSNGGGRRPLRGREFIEVRKRLLAMFFGDGAAGAER